MRNTRIVAAALLSAATLASPAFAMPAGTPHTPARPPVVQTAACSDQMSSSFDWSSAGIGAAGGVGAFAIALAGIAGTRRRRLPHPELMPPPSHGTQSRRSAPGRPPPQPIPITEVGTRRHKGDSP
jgi:hypothetical protein